MVCAAVFFRVLGVQLVIPILGALLVLTTPVGTGQGVHANELLHPLWSHAHLIDGRMVSDEQMAAARASAQPDGLSSGTAHGPVLGAGTGAETTALGLAVGPTPPPSSQTTLEISDFRLVLGEAAPPVEFRESPQDPPPNLFA